MVTTTVTSMATAVATAFRGARVAGAVKKARHGRNARTVVLPRGSRLRVSFVGDEIVVEPMIPTPPSAAPPAPTTRHLVPAAGWSVDVRRTMPCGAAATVEAIEDEVVRLKGMGFDVRKRDGPRPFHACRACGHVFRDRRTRLWSRCCDDWMNDSYGHAEWMIMNARVA